MRKLKGLDVMSLTHLLGGLHHCLTRLLEDLPVPVAKTDEEKKPSKIVEVPLQHLEEEFERHWRLRFDARAVGEPNTAAFLKRFPEVFGVRSNGFQIMVKPKEDPNFEEAAEVGMEQADVQSDIMPDFTTSCAEQVISLMVNLVAEERKSGGAPLNFQYASHEVVQALVGKVRDGSSREEQNELLNTLLDPKPQPVLKEEPRRQERRRSESADRGGQAIRDRSPRRSSPPRRDDFMGGKGSGNYSDRPQQRVDRRGNDGRSVCRQFQAGRCTYGDSCKFAHELDNGGGGGRW
jgi:hypothetical protein